MKLSKLALTISASAVVLSSLLTAPTVLAQVKEQFFPVLVYRTGAYATNGSQWANGYVDYLKLINARGGLMGSRSVSRNARRLTPPIEASNATSV